MELFGLSLAFYLLGALASLAFAGRETANHLGPAGAVAGSLVGLAGLALTPASAVAQASLPWGLPLGSLALGLDPASRLFLLPVYAVGAAAAVAGSLALAGSEAAQAGPDRRGTHWFFFNILLAGLALVMAARDGVVFLIAWEVMSLAPFFLGSLHDDEAEVREAAWTYLVCAHLGAALVIAFFALAMGQAGATGFAALAEAARAGRLTMPSLLFFLAFFGFAAKIGLVPFHVWLPAIYPAAPGHVAALMSGGMINVGLYGLWRALEILPPPAAWQGWTIAGLGVASALLGILAALGQGNLKRLLAYSSVENMGLICLGLGLGLVGLACGNPAMAALGLGGALFHMLCHAGFKSLLFLCAAEVLTAVGSARIAHLGGLAKRMPAVGTLFLLAGAGIAGLPPLPGFIGELTMALAMLAGLDLPGLLPRTASAASLAALAAVGGFALAAFAKAGGLAFLGAPRTPAAAKAEAPSHAALLAPLFLAAGLVTAAALAPALLRFVGQAVLAFPGMDPAPARAALEQAAMAARTVGFFGAGIILLAGGLLWLRARAGAAHGRRREPTWGCGYTAPTARMQYGAASFVEPAAKLLAGPMGLTRRLDMDPGLFPKRATLFVVSRDAARDRLFTPLFEAVARLCDAAKVVQHGKVHLYILYVLATVVLLLAWKLS
ncbi:MAG: formate hydrogenlyase subunit 3/multisubunit Na+/H+ antiporter, MnhD subunit [Solidesulfovibrio magneticus str. Maddingley MBC34]|uniref:Formate hydrogenlyase subunit 3/multisubunit Na+/H+ antiporter, MnhD subunit n=1 Tax=Solidesulfovibrio magneticus str. Maddingley MBC34 TaxID=1206767 RepID=K6GDY1_9BACT|nr:MAG: formate hydrogenlyase subunit 3/multisubunit Na+/H+ antiporter, MnhD subunit [Solidesulfovibrio magneticus str. Maddingley MBC34]